MFEDARLAMDGEEIERQLSSLLPDNGTQLEYDLIANDIKRVDGVQNDIQLGALLDPSTAAESLLPWLAWQYSIDLWDDTWSLDQKRNVIKEWVRLHRMKGTAAGIKEHVRLAGGQVLKIVAPPVKAFSGRSYTQAERDAFLAPMPQLRIYRFLTNGSGKGKIFTRSGTLNLPRKTFCGRHNKTGWSYRACAPLTDASGRIGSRTYYWDHETGPGTPLTTVTVQKQDVTHSAVQQISMKGQAGLAVFPHRTFLTKGNAILNGKKSSGALFTVQIDDNYVYSESSLHLNAISPSLTPIDTRYQYVQETGKVAFGQAFPKHHGGYHGQCLTKRFLPPSTARTRLYQRIYLFDSSRAVSTSRGRQFLGNMRLGMPAYTAEISILVTNKRLRNSANDFVRGVLHKTPQTKLEACLRAVRIAKAARDKTLVRIGLYDIPYLGRGLPLDTDYRFSNRVLGNI